MENFEDPLEKRCGNDRILRSSTTVPSTLRKGFARRRGPLATFTAKRRYGRVLGRPFCFDLFAKPYFKELN